MQATFRMIWISIAIFLLLKLFTLIDFRRTTGRRVTLVEALAWHFAWPGLSCRDFFTRLPRDDPGPPLREWLAAAAKTAFGASTLWLASIVIRAHPLLGGWVAMVGVIFVMHFGAFHILALLWRLAGRDVHPIMNAPICAHSVGNFWGARWNLAFRDLTSDYLLTPLNRLRRGRKRLLSPACVTLACFGFSGGIHELAISVPAGGGYGLPMAYFMLQGIAAIVERSRIGRMLGLRSGAPGRENWCIRGRAYSAIVIAGPAYVLFHPPFVLSVIVPLFS